ncbi:MAG TPA: S8 family serine peptidase [Ktedonobacteraceae bacterium]|nr:S8 family serine peptidase [Ktedonobacteraceae bacterium]
MKKLAVSILMVALVAFTSVNFAVPVHAHTITRLALRYKPICTSARPGVAHCDAIQVYPAGHAAGSNTPSGLAPSDLRSAYKLPTTSAGHGQTIAIVNTYDNPRAEADMAVYRSHFGLPACTSANACFRKVDQNGTSRYPRPDAAWAQESAIDLDMVSAICPHCHILLVEASIASAKSLSSAVNTAVRLGATIVSNSYGIEEVPAEVSYAPYFNHPGVIITASTGDTGYGTEFPAVYNSVVSVGGTTLSRSNNARGWNETAWNSTGSGCSQYISKPGWQSDTGCSKRSIADVAAVADPATGVAVYDTYDKAGGWLLFGGTSVATPIIASTYALAGNAARINAASSLYSHPDKLFHVTRGNNGTCNTAYLCNAAPGYNGPTGLGTPDGVGAF